MSRLLGILGGAFNPPHHGHLRAALEVKEKLGLDTLLLVPSGQHPFKKGGALAGATHRLAMTRLACGQDGDLETSSVEVERTTTTYTIDTLAQLSERYPGYELVFLMGRDLLKELHLWKGWQTLLNIAHLCQMMRPGPINEPGAQPVVEEWLQNHQRSDYKGLSRDAEGRMGFVRLPITQLDISSSDIRARVQEGKSIRFLTPDSVIGYIHDHGLYRNASQS
ncbi:MAG: nicotinate (nicotinamide) nucleotide adenylyltransferase [Magnetococcales bacterium]|nr:nicotinate (nicotinamide) nucleotide adenylyltransferase [Magnetococcales bacterium]